MIPHGVLDVAPVPPPKIARSAVGKVVSFASVVADARMPDVVSTHSPPQIRIHAGEGDLRVPRAGSPIYCIGGATLPMEREARAKEIMRRLAYGFLDWAARETVGRYHRDLKRANQPVKARKDMPVSVQVRRLIRTSPGISVGEIAARTGIAQPNVSRVLAILSERGEVRVKRSGRDSAWYLPEDEATPGIPSLAKGG